MEVGHIVDLLITTPKALREYATLSSDRVRLKMLNQRACERYYIDKEETELSHILIGYLYRTSRTVIAERDEALKELVALGKRDPSCLATYSKESMKTEAEEALRQLQKPRPYDRSQPSVTFAAPPEEDELRWEPTNTTL